MSEFVRLKTSSLVTINRVAAILEQKGIPTMVKDHTESARLAGFGAAQNDVDLFVNNADLEKAKNAIQAFEEAD